MFELNGKKKVVNEGDENFTFLGRGVDFKGIINFDGTVRIDGRLEGEVHTKGTLVIGEHAIIKGLISAGTLICGGRSGFSFSSRRSLLVIYERPPL